MQKFYHDVKEHMSPSAFDQWHRQRSAFVGSYFEQKERVQTKAMEAGTQIHRLIEAGLIKAKCVYDVGEEQIKVQVPGTEFYFLGIPDSHMKDGSKFVDYKSGKANDWKEKLPTDLKMKATAWLVWMQCGQPEKIEGAIEFIQTTWDPDAKRVVPIDDKETELIEITYHAEDLKAFTKVIADTMNEVNEVYEKWQSKTDAFVSREDIERYEALHLKKAALEEEMDDVKERIKTQMEFGGMLNFKSELGTFYITERSTYDYPETLPVKVGAEEYTLAEAEEVESATKAAKKNYELITEPVSQSSSVGFRPKKEKK